MPISTICNACKARLTVPDAALGKRVKCRNCQAIFEVTAPPPDGDSDFEVVETPAAPARAATPARLPVPAARNDDGDSDFEVVSSPAAPAAKAAKPAVPAPSAVVKALLDDDDDDVPSPKVKSKRKTVDDEDSEDKEKPKGKTKRKAADDEDSDEDDDAPKKKKSNLVKILLLVGGGFFAVAMLVVVGIVVSIYVVGKKVTEEAGKSGVSNNSIPSMGNPIPSIAPVTWVPFDNTTTQYTAAFPGGQPTKLDPFEYETDPKNKQFAESAVKSTYQGLDLYGYTVDNRRYLIGGAVYTPQYEKMIDPKRTMAQIDTFAGVYYKDAVQKEAKPILVNGNLGKDYVFTQGNRIILMRFILTKKGGYQLRVEGDPGMKEDDSTAKAFFEKFAIKAGPGPYTEKDVKR